eukprot:jgi/Chlat1/7728/Chrsp66S07320
MRPGSAQATRMANLKAQRRSSSSRRPSARRLRHTPATESSPGKSYVSQQRPAEQPNKAAADALALAQLEDYARGLLMTHGDRDDPAANLARYAVSAPLPDSLADACWEQPAAAASRLRVSRGVY